MSVPDYRILLQPAKLDFDALGINDGQDISQFPAPSSQARYDWMRSVILGLLSQQASYSEPTQRVNGTPWYDLNTQTLKIRRDDTWVAYSETIPLTEPDGNTITLAEWYAAVAETLASFAQEVVFSGICSTNSVTNITIPESLRANVGTDSRVFLHINGLLVDPHNCSLIGTPPSTIKLTGAALSAGDTFIVSIRRIGSNTYLPTTIVIS